MNSGRASNIANAKEQILIIIFMTVPWRCNVRSEDRFIHRENKAKERCVATTQAFTITN